MHDQDLVDLLDVALRVGDAQDDCWIDCRAPRGSILSYSVAGTVAKSIIGMANRDEQTARKFNDGIGYVVVGMEKGNAPGIREVPAEKLAEALRPYLGEDPPEWRHRWVVFRGSRLLVFEVPAAGPGAAIYCLNREFDKEPLAAIYVRHPGRTAVATPDELIRLTDRARGWSLRGITLELGTGVAHRLDLCADSAQAWLVRERARLLAPVDNLPEKPSAPTGTVARLRNQRERLGRRFELADAVSPSQQRTPEDYRREVANYLGECAQVLEAAVRRSANRLSPVSLRLVNTTAEFWAELVLTLQLPGQAWALHPGEEGRGHPVEPTLLGLPDAPQPWAAWRVEIEPQMSGAAGGPRSGSSRDVARAGTVIRNDTVIAHDALVSQGTVIPHGAASRDDTVTGSDRVIQHNTVIQGDTVSRANTVSQANSVSRAIVLTRDQPATQPTGLAYELTGSGQVRFEASDLRPGASLELGPLVVCTEVAGPLYVSWNVTGRVRGSVSGTLEIPVGAQVWTPLDLIGACKV